MKIIRPFLLLLSVFSAYGVSIPADRLPPLGYWNPGVIGINGLTYRQNGSFVVPVVLTNIINVKSSPYNAVGNGVTDDTAAIQAAIAAGANSVIYLPTGTYKVSDRLELASPGYPYSWSSKILRGDGPTNTFIKSSSANTCAIGVEGGGPDWGQVVTVSASAARGSTTVTLANWNNSFNSENWGIFFINNTVSGAPYTSSEVQAYEGNAKSQIVHIIGRNPGAHTITFDPPLYFDIGANWQFTVFVGSVDSAVGIENLSVENVGGNSIHNFNFLGVANCWVRNVESKNAYKWHIRFADCTRCTVEGCYVHGYYPANGVGGGDSVYGVGFFQQSSDNLAVNNHFDRTRHAMIVEYGDIGNVFAYNYSSSPINEGQENTDYLMGEMIQHGVTAYNLWEGNIAPDFNMDDVLGGSLDNMSFRNNLTRVSQLNTLVLGWGYDIQIHNYNVGIVGNVLNNVGSVTPTWRVGAPDGNGDYASTNPAVWADTPGGGDYYPDPTGTAADPMPTLYVHGVVDLQSNVTTWVSSNADHTLPSSLWLATPPTFMTGYVFPPIGPDVSGYTNPIPAFLNYFGNATGLTNPLTVNYSLTVNSGTGSSSNPSGSTVQITAASPPAGFQFSYWSGDIGTVANINSASTFVTILTTNTTITANFVPLTSSSGPATSSSGPATAPSAPASPSSPVTSTNGTVAWYAFDDGSGSLAADSSGNGNVGTLVNSPVWTSGIIGSGALSFNGNNQYVSVADNDSLTFANKIFTFAFWLKAPTQPNNSISDPRHPIFSKWNQYTGGEYGIYILDAQAGTSKGRITVMLDGTSENSIGGVSSIVAMDDNKWHFVAITSDGTINSIYIDGKLNNMATLGGSSMQNTTAPLDIGWRQATTGMNPLLGTLDDFRIYNRALSADEVQGIYSAVPTILPSPPGKLFIMSH